MQSDRQVTNKCFSCGTTALLGKRKFCSDECHVRLRKKLDQAKGLLTALNTYYAVFSFTDDIVALDVLPKGYAEIYSFIYPRSANRAPADDFGKINRILGNAWWQEKNRTNKKHLAAMMVLEQANGSHKEISAVKPVTCSLPLVKNKYLKCLKLKKDDLGHSHVADTIKSAFRLQAKKHHPDVGGSAESFRKIQKAYGELADWAKDPSYVRRKGLPDKWLYDGFENRWMMPILAG